MDANRLTRKSQEALLAGDGSTVVVDYTDAGLTVSWAPPQQRDDQGQLA